MSVADALTWSTAPPRAAEYVALRAATGLGPRSEASARRALPQSLHAVCVRDGDRLVAMGRAVGDGGCFVLLTDMAVAPDWQGRGLGRALLNRLIAWCETALPPDCHISLVSSERAAPLYRSAGFRPCRGMDRYADPARPSPP
ncbi:MAG: GNAT family N-acetyltransferase [Pseudomonadota bacterium]